MGSRTSPPDAVAPSLAPAERPSSLPPPASPMISSAAARFPSELVLHIVELGAHYSPESYAERQAFLRSCCLVSRRWRSFAQPLLNKVMHVRMLIGARPERATKRLKALGASNGVAGGLAASLRILALESVETQVVLKMLRLCTGLESLTLSRLERMSLWASLPHLRHLAIDSSELMVVRSNFPQLEELCLSTIDFLLPRVRPAPACEHLLCRSAFLSLRVLVWNGVSLDGQEVSPSACAEQSFLDQLDILCLDRPDPAVPAGTRHVLYDLPLGNSLSTNSTSLETAHHARLNLEYWSGGDWRAEGIKDWTTLLADILPLLFASSTSLPTTRAPPTFSSKLGWTASFPSALSGRLWSSTRTRGRSLAPTSSRRSSGSACGGVLWRSRSSCRRRAITARTRRGRGSHGTWQTGAARRCRKTKETCDASCEC